MKFLKLLRKELREILTAQAIIGIVVIAVLFMLLGNVMTTVTQNMVSSTSTVLVSDQDNSAHSVAAIEYLKSQGTEVKKVAAGDPVKMLADAKMIEPKNNSVLVIPAGFGANIDAGKVSTLEKVSAMTSFSMLGDNDESASDAAKVVSKYISTTIAGGSGLDAEYINNPVEVNGITVVGDKSTVADANMLKSFGMSQSMFIPIIVFILITFATQLNCAAIANEKNDKTLETLLSTPVSRLSIIGSKMCASAIYSLLMAVVFIGCFIGVMGKMTGADMESMGASSTSGLNDALTALGIKLGGAQFVGLGIQLFLTIVIALTISMILGGLAKDLKSTQGLIMPLMFATMIPYFVTMFTDINTLPTVAQVILYAIPFTHTFASTTNLMFGHEWIYLVGLVYQVIWLVGVIWLAVRIFSSDKIFTMTLEFKKKTKAKAN